MKIAILNDTHAGIRNSSEIFMEYQQKFYRDVFFPYLLENNITKIWHLGDYYDNRKFVNFKALHHNRRIFLTKLREYGITMDIIPGNHDTYYKNTNALNSLKELLGHYMDEVNIIMEPTVIEYDGLPVAWVPWINPRNEAASLEFVKSCRADVLCAHLELNGFEMQAGMPCHDGMDPSHFDRFDTVLSGHFHTKSQQQNIHYLGSQMEFFWNDAHDKKYFHIFDTETRELTPVQNPITIFERIYYDDTREGNDYLNMSVEHLDDKFVKLVVMNKSDPFVFDMFVDRIQNRQIHELKIAENFQEFIGTAVDDDKVSVEDTETLLYTYIDAVDTHLDKNRIKKDINELMIEAQTLEIA